MKPPYAARPSETEYERIARQISAEFNANRGTRVKAKVLETHKMLVRSKYKNGYGAWVEKMEQTAKDNAAMSKIDELGTF